TRNGRIGDLHQDPDLRHAVDHPARLHHPLLSLRATQCVSGDARCLRRARPELAHGGSVVAHNVAADHPSAVETRYICRLGAPVHHLPARTVDLDHPLYLRHRDAIGWGLLSCELRERSADRSVVDRADGGAPPLRHRVPARRRTRGAAGLMAGCGGGVMQTAEHSSRYVEVQGLVKWFGNDPAVNGISFSIPRGKFLTLLGPSGCGKTTTLMSIAGLHGIDAGIIRVGGVTYTSKAEGIFLPPEKRDIGMVFQSYAIWPHMTVVETVAYPLEIRKMASDEIRDRVAAVLRLVGLTEMAGKLATQLSGGQQQRTALARAIISHPRLLLFDEPLSNLDLKLREQMRVELKRIQHEVGITSIYVTHDHAEALVMSDEIIV